MGTGTGTGMGMGMDMPPPGAAAAGGGTSLGMLLLLLLLGGIAVYALVAVLQLQQRDGDLNKRLSAVESEVGTGSGSPGSPPAPSPGGTTPAAPVILPAPLALRVTGPGDVATLPGSRHGRAYRFTMPTALATQLSSSIQYALRLAWSAQATKPVASITRALELTFTDGASRFVGYQQADARARSRHGSRDAPTQQGTVLLQDRSDAAATDLVLRPPYVHDPTATNDVEWRLMHYRGGVTCVPGTELGCFSLATGGTALSEEVVVVLPSGKVLQAVTLHLEAAATQPLPDLDGRLVLSHTPISQ